MKVLHVDDESDIREIVLLALELDGAWQVSSVGSALEALEHLARDRPDLILLDMMMPGMSGPDLKRHLDADPTLRSIPVIFMTAAAQEQTKADLLALDAIGVIEKPFDSISLGAQIKALLKSSAKAEARAALV